MLLELRVRDYAVVDDLTLRLRPGLNVLSGETGAGKSVLVGALSLLLGERASSDLIRAGASRAVVEAVFEVEAAERGSGSDVQGSATTGGSPADRSIAAHLDGLGIEPEEGLVVLRREVHREGRNRAWINGSPATASMVGELGSALVDLHGQHEHQTLLRAGAQRELLDEFGAAGTLLERVSAAYEARRAAEAALSEREELQRELEARADFLRFQLREIDEAKIDLERDRDLPDEVHRLDHHEELAEGANALHDALYAGEDSVSDRVAEARDRLRDLARIDPALDEFTGTLDSLYHQVVEVARELGRYGEGTAYDPAELERLRRRLDLISRLTRKYGPELDDVVATAKHLRTELDQLESGALDLEELRRGAGKATEELAGAATALGAARREGAKRLEERMEALLPGLGLPGALFRVDFVPLDEPGPQGGETVRFLVSLNPGFEPGPLSRIVSGGELSRVMLALRTALVEVDRVPTLVFDEVDAGIGGEVARTVGERLAALGNRHQVLVVTHLAQIAALARYHFRVEKREEAGLAAARIDGLDGEERVHEVARMLGGDPESEASLRHARALLGSQPPQSLR